MSDLIDRIDEQRGAYHLCGFQGTATDKLLADCKAEIKRLIVWPSELYDKMGQLRAEIKRLTEQLKTQKEYYENVIEDGVKQIKEQKMKRLETQGMADCMDMVMQELQGAGVISKDIPPMMLPEAILAKLSAVGEPVKIEYYLPKHGEWTDDLGEYEDYAKSWGTDGIKERKLYTAPPSVAALIAEIDIPDSGKMVQPEPVAYRHWCECDTDEAGNPVFDWEYFDKASCKDCQPLYTTPPSIEALIAEIDSVERKCFCDGDKLSEILDKYRSAKCNDEGEVRLAITSLIAEAVAKEREACALTCVRFGKTLEDNNGENYAEEIRARGTK